MRYRTDAFFGSQARLFAVKEVRYVKMTAFIQGHIEDILAEWDTFARSIQPERSN